MPAEELSPHQTAATSSGASSSSPSPHGAPRIRAGEQQDDESRLPPPPPPTTRGPGRKRRRRGAWDPLASSWATEWDRAYLLACAAGLMVDPLFLYAVSVSAPLMCVFLDAWFAAAVTALRCAVDAMHASNLLLRLREACSPPRREGDTDEEEAQPQPGRDDARCGGAGAGAGLPGRARSKKGVFLDVLVILPVMQVRRSSLSVHDSRVLFEN